MTEVSASHASIAGGFQPASTTKASGSRPPETASLSEKHALWLETERKIPCEIAVRANVVSIGPALAFEFRKSGKLCYRKLRRESENGKSFVRDRQNVPSIMWNIDCLQEPSSPDDPLVICEGEMDGLSWMTAGVTHIVSVPDGAQLAKRGEGKIIPEEDKPFAYLWDGDDLIPGLDRFKRIILATDGDEKGRILRDELAVRLGRLRCWFVEYPEGCKDANDVLVKHGVSALTEMLDQAKPLVPNRLVPFSHIPRRADRQQYKSGWSLLDDHLRMQFPELMIVTGSPNSGKSTWTLSYVSNMARIHGIKTAILQFEDDVDRNRSELEQYVANWSRGGPGSIHDPETWIDRMFRTISPAEENDVYDLKWLRASIIEAATRHDCKIVLIDPYNEIEHLWSANETEAQYTNNCLRDLKKLARQLQIAIIIVTHPSKAAGVQKPIAEWSLYDVAGCYSDDTEVLTKRGWLRHAELTHADDIACFNPENESVEYHQPNRIIRKDYSGTMHHFSGAGYDLLVTPEHRMLVMPEWSEPVGGWEKGRIGRPIRFAKDKWSFVRADQCPGSPLSIPKAGIAVPGDDPATILGCKAEPFLEFLGWYIAEGSVHPQRGLSLVQAVGNAADSIELSLVNSGFSFSSYVFKPSGKGKKDCRKWYVGVRDNRTVVEWVRSNCGRGSATKRIPDFIFELSPRLKRIFLDAYLDGDGTRYPYGSSATTTSPVLKDQLQRLAVELGIPTTLSRCIRGKAHHKDRWQIQFNGQHRRKVTMRKCRNMTLRNYSGPVWCLTVPTGAYFVRRNGSVAVCGNSAAWNNKADHGVVIWRENTKAVETYVKVCKSKNFKTMGSPGTVIMEYDCLNGMFNAVGKA